MSRDRPSGQHFAGFLRPDHVLQNQAGIVLRRQFRGKGRDHVAGIQQAQSAQNGFGGEPAVAPIHHFRANDIDRDRSRTEHGLGHGADKEFADRSWGMSSHDDPIDCSFACIRKDLVGGQSRPDHDLAAQPQRPGAFGQGLEMIHFGTRGGSVVVVADSRCLRGRNHQRVISMKENQIRAEFGGLCQRKGEGLFIGGDFGGEQDGCGLAPTRLQDGCHGNLLAVRRTEAWQVWERNFGDGRHGCL